MDENRVSVYLSASAMVQQAAISLPYWGSLSETLTMNHNGRSEHSHVGSCMQDCCFEHTGLMCCTSGQSGRIAAFLYPVPSAQPGSEARAHAFVSKTACQINDLSNMLCVVNR